ncbi:MAG TPA: YkvA family protein [Methanoregulaceae archaeon]|nr:YkvA family protein [Methanoregulaceae archaeon]HRY76410.1 YkvA family protein [Methanoregulaceae archaeon]
MASFASFQQRAEALMCDVHALYLARNDPRIPWYAKAIIVLTVVYALSPIDLVPDFIPGIGFLDDLVIIPLGIALALRCMPQDVWDEYRKKARAEFTGIRLDSFEGVLLILFILLGLWKILLLGIATFLIGFFLMVYFGVQQGFLNIGTLIVALGLMIFLIAGVKFQRRLTRWKKTMENSRPEDSGTG